MRRTIAAILAAFACVLAFTATAAAGVHGTGVSRTGHTYTAIPLACSPSAVSYQLNLNLSEAHPPPWVKVWWGSGSTTCGNLINAKGKFCVPDNGPCHLDYGPWTSAINSKSQASGTTINYLKEAWAQMKNGPGSGSFKCKAELWPTLGGWKC